MAQPVERKLQFSIYSCSGEDPAYPAAELLRSGADARGWQSPKGAGFPVELAVALAQPAHLERVQILSHEFKIAERLELFAGVVPPGGRDPHWQRLGSIGLDPNQRSGYQARELKTVGLRVAASHLRFVARACHANALNAHRQLRTMDDELALVKTCILQLYTGRPLQAPAPGAPAAPAAPAAPPGRAYGAPGAAGPAAKLF